ncbi:MAG: transcriptional regulator [Burkholderiales bacterium RIFCSPLOWO2_02_FULL_57_36]|nr:MAG: transcriptional regulator [Burkholderiales bacterium RIFCSPLOWO2_02_FULL_57_36]
MKDGPNIVGIAALIGDHARADVLTALMTGQALTATELAEVAGVTKQTISGHLAKLLDASLIEVESQGRHRYFRLANHDVAELLESLMGVAFRTGAIRVRSSPSEPALRKARVCYDHLAGELGVLVYENLLQVRALQLGTAGLELTAVGQQLFQHIGVDVDSLAGKRRTFCNTCLDWSERRHHLAGALGAALLSRIEELGWAKRVKGSRVVAFSATGEKALNTWCARIVASSPLHRPKKTTRNKTSPASAA